MSKTTDYEKMALHAIGASIYNSKDRYVCEVSHTARHVELIDCNDWDRSKESWLEFYTRVKPEREAEEAKRYQFAQDICIAYNEKFVKE